MASKLVILETMPDCHRASHRAANNWGRFPMNGAERVLVERAEAKAIVADDADGYDRIVRPATRTESIAWHRSRRLGEAQ